MKDMYDFMRVPPAMRHRLLCDEMDSADKAMEKDISMSRFPDKTPIGMAYVPYQQWGDTYSPQEGFCRGTIFPELDFPFKGGDCAYE